MVDRFRLSAVSSLASALIALWLFLAYPNLVSPLVSLSVFAIDLVDAYVKYYDRRDLREYTTVLYSLGNAALILAGFFFAGYPWSYLFASVWVLDAILKLPGVNTRWEGRFRHLWSFLDTALLGLTLLFSIRIFGSVFLSVLVGWFVLYDAWVKLVYVRDSSYFVS